MARTQYVTDGVVTISTQGVRSVERVFELFLHPGTEVLVVRYHRARWCGRRIQTRGIGTRCSRRSRRRWRSRILGRRRGETGEARHDVRAHL